MTAAAPVPSPVPARPARGRVGRVLRVLVVLGAALLVLGATGLFLLQQHLAGQLGRVDGAFAGLEHRPARPAEGPGADALNILLLGAEHGGADGQTSGEWFPGLTSSSTLLLVHITGDRLGVSVVWLPGSTPATIPGRGAGPLRSVYEQGGPTLTIATVEALTGVRVDHLAVVDWRVFAELQELNGGASVDLPDVGPAEREREPDLARIARQQQVLRATMDDSLHTSMRKDLPQLYRFLDLATRRTAVDSDWSSGELGSLVISLRGLRSANIRYLTAPPDPAGLGLWDAVREDRVDNWFREHPGAGISDTLP